MINGNVINLNIVAILAAAYDNFL